LGERKLILIDCNMYAVACYWSADRKEEERKLT
jgi:hypothetical protein